MKVKLNLNPETETEYAEIHVRSLTPEIRRAIELLQGGGQSGRIQAMQGERVFLLEPADIAYAIVEGDRCKVIAGEEVYLYKATLKSFGELTEGGSFIRISKSCIANLDFVRYYEASFGGSLVIVFKNGHKEYVSRSYTKSL
ncbi:LytTR family DNA-binding domain-containing protein [Bhargavaea ullalensis]|uniref:DNA-binding LytR/AlgR family response regulator n=1 Tax=Bhargavaea ullalensis TaxID=1265685 RepID=A0ABV2GEA8_9BACL